jgi:hypothetical protein
MEEKVILYLDSSSNLQQKINSFVSQLIVVVVEHLQLASSQNKIKGISNKYFCDFCNKELKVKQHAK